MQDSHDRGNDTRDQRTYRGVCTGESGVCACQGRLSIEIQCSLVHAKATCWQAAARYGVCVCVCVFGAFAGLRITWYWLAHPPSSRFQCNNAAGCYDRTEQVSTCVMHASIKATPRTLSVFAASSDSMLLRRRPCIVAVCVVRALLRAQAAQRAG